MTNIRFSAGLPFIDDIPTLPLNPGLKTFPENNKLKIYYAILRNAITCRF
jgi:hypothetical protein